MKKGDLVWFEYLTSYPSGVGWKLHKEVGLIISHDTSNDSFIIMMKDGKTIERLDIQVDLISSTEKQDI